MVASRNARAWVRSLRRLLTPTPRPRWPALSPVARRIEHAVHLLDSAVRIPGTQFRLGLDPILGLVLPGVGDAVGGFVSLGMLFLAVQYRVPTPIVGRMVVNIGVDSVIGAIPIVGDVLDFGWKANERNFELMALHRGDLPQRHAPLAYWLSVTAWLLLGSLCVAAPIALVAWLIMRVHG